MAKQVYIHVIDECSDNIVFKYMSYFVPRVGDELRHGGENAEKYYLVHRIVWALDEALPYERVNIGVTLQTSSTTIE